ncbi:MAG TPA: AAA family ATPase [Fimbriimonadaceae bacterium]|nr:AAA family ATPase [Fimbriimonadaceae bacterium]
MKVVAVINYKGGVGKTSLTANLGAELAWRGKRVLMLDLDPQASLTFSFIAPDEWESDFSRQGTIKSWFDSFESGTVLPLESLIYTPPRSARRLRENGGKLDLIPSHLALINVDLELATKLGGATIAQGKKNFLRIHRRLAEGLRGLESQYDLVLIDCPPNFNIVTKTAIVASDYILVPARPDNLSTLGIDYLIRSVNQLVRDYNDYAAVDDGEVTPAIDPKILGVVFTMIQEYGGVPIGAQRPFIDRIRARQDVAVFENYIKRNDTLFADVSQYGVPIVLINFGSNATHQSVVRGLERVADDFVAAVGVV